MSALRYRVAFLIALALLSACASAGDRLNEGIALQSQGRYMEAVYRYAEAVEKDPNLAGARERLVAAADTATIVAMDEADELERRGNPVASAERYRAVDAMVARARQVGVRLDLPADYETIRRTVFDNAIAWRMTQGTQAVELGRWEEARGHFAGARADFLIPSRTQVDQAYESEIATLLDWAETELVDGHPRAAHGLAQEAVDVRGSPSRDVVLRVRDLQARALEAGTVVVAILPVTGSPGVREYLGPEFEIRLDEDLTLDHWNNPPLFVGVADPVILRRELRGLLRGQVAQTPFVVGRALGLIGADLGALIEISSIEVVEKDVEESSREVVIPLAANSGRGADRRVDQQMDTVTYITRRGTMSYYLEAQIVLVDTGGREVRRFTSSARAEGPFQRGVFDGVLPSAALPEQDRPYFDANVIASQVARVEGQLREDLAVAIAAGTYDTVLEVVR